MNKKKIIDGLSKELIERQKIIENQSRELEKLDKEQVNIAMEFLDRYIVSKTLNDNFETGREAITIELSVPRGYCSNIMSLFLNGTGREES